MLVYACYESPHAAGIEHRGVLSNSKIRRPVAAIAGPKTVPSMAGLLANLFKRVSVWHPMAGVLHGMGLWDGGTATIGSPLLNRVSLTLQTKTLLCPKISIVEEPPAVRCLQATGHRTLPTAVIGPIPLNWNPASSIKGENSMSQPNLTGPCSVGC